MHKENEYSSHLQLLLLTYAHGTCVQDSWKKPLLHPWVPWEASLQTSPATFSLCGAEPVLALGTGSSSQKMQIAGEQQKKSLHEGIHAHTCCQVAGEPRGLLQSWRERSGWGSSLSWLQQERERHLPLPSVVNKLIFTTPCRNFAPSMVGQFTFRSSKRHSKGSKNSGTFILQQVQMRDCSYLVSEHHSVY